MSDNSRRNFIKTVSLATAVIASPTAIKNIAAQNSKKPNIVLILVDDLGWADIGCYGSTYYETPNVDRLAQEGMKFTNGYAACAVCSPTRAAVMTGRYPARTGITDWIRASWQGAKLPADKKNPSGFAGSKNQKVLCPRNPYWMELSEITIAEALKPAGYKTCHIGKWHLGLEDWYPEKQGFDINIAGSDFGHPPTYFDPYKRGEWQLNNLPPRKTGEYLTDREGDEAANFINNHKDESFFLYYAPYAVHTPIQGREDLVAKYKNKKPKAEQTNATYAAMVESMDSAVGKILGALKTNNLEKETIVIFTSDNGGLMGPTHNAPLRSGKGFPHEGGVREPVIVRWPGKIKPNSISEELVTSVDYFPTLCAAAGVDLPKDRVIDGENLIPVLTKNASLKRDAIYWHFPHYRSKNTPPYSIIRKGDWKLIRWYDSDKEMELYNLKKDISEAENLVDEMPEKVKELDEQLTKYLKDCDAKLPIPNPDYVVKKMPTKGTKSKDFSFIKAASVDSSSLGYLVNVDSTEGGYALKKLKSPIKTKATFQFKMQSESGEWKNGFFVFGDSTTNGKLIKCGMYLGGNRKCSIIEGDFNSGPKKEEPYKGDPQQVLDVSVTVDVQTGNITLNSGGVEVKYQLNKPIKKITYIGYGAINTSTMFSEIKIN